MKLYSRILLMAFLALSISYQAEAQLFGKRNKVLTGEYSADKLAQNDQQRWFTSGMKAYDPNPETVAKLQKQWSPDLKILAFGGSWCPDTHREMPAFFRTLNEAGIPDKDIDLYFLNHKMESGTQMEEKYNITAVPTFIVLRNGEEIGRIKERSQMPPGQALLQIIQ